MFIGQMNLNLNEVHLNKNLFNPAHAWPSSTYKRKKSKNRSYICIRNDLTIVKLLNKRDIVHNIRFAVQQNAQKLFGLSSSQS